MKINKNFLDLEASYLFSTVNKKTREFMAAHPQADVIKLSIGDVTKPLCPAVIEAMHKAVDEMADEKTFRGYPPEQGYDFIREKILECDYTKRGIDLKLDEIFLSDGAKSDCGNIGDIFATDNTVAICDPVYPVYIDTNIMNGRKNKIIILPCSAETDFLPAIPAAGDTVPDIIYLCFPNNPTGAVLTHEQLSQWVDYARRNHSLIIFDAAYEAYISTPGIPHSIYEIEGAKEVAIEVRSFSKSAGFTAVRCGYTVVPYETGLQAMWMRRQCTKYNGTAYISQRAAQATYTPEGRAAVNANVAYYMETAQMIRQGLQEAGLQVFGGIDAPYIWCATPNGMGSWDFFDLLLNRCKIICTPGVGFGPSGEGYVRFSAFSRRDDVLRALERIHTDLPL